MRFTTKKGVVGYIDPKHYTLYFIHILVITGQGGSE